MLVQNMSFSGFTPILEAWLEGKSKRLSLNSKDFSFKSKKLFLK